MSLTTADILALPDSPQKRAMLAQLKRKVDPDSVGDTGCMEAMVSHAMALKTGPNARLSRMERSRLVKQERTVAAQLLRSQRQIPRLPVVVTLTRVGKRALDDDNLRGAFKAVRDGVADVYGLDDRDERIRFVYAQNIGEFEPAIWIDVRRSAPLPDWPGRPYDEGQTHVVEGGR